MWVRWRHIYELMAPYIRGVPYIRVDGVIYTSLSSQIYDLFMNYSLILLEASQSSANASASATVALALVLLVDDYYTIVYSTLDTRLALALVLV